MSGLGLYLVLCTVSSVDPYRFSEDKYNLYALRRIHIAAACMHL